MGPRRALVTVKSGGSSKSHGKFFITGNFVMRNKASFVISFNCYFFNVSLVAPREDYCLIANTKSINYCVK